MYKVKSPGGFAMDMGDLTSNQRKSLALVSELLRSGHASARQVNAFVRKKSGFKAAKRQPSKYIQFASAERKNIKKDHPGYSFGEIGKELGKRWREKKAKAKK